MTQRIKRRRKLIEPRIQLRFSLTFFSVAGIAMLVQSVVLGFALQDLAERVPNDGYVILGNVPRVVGTSLLITFFVLVPLTLVVGVRSTFPIVGPLYRFRAYLTRVAAGERLPDCKIRKGDELQDMCALINRATAPLRIGPARTVAGSAGGQDGSGANSAGEQQGADPVEDRRHAA